MKLRPEFIALAVGAIGIGIVICIALRDSQIQATPLTKLTPPKEKREFYHSPPGHASIDWWPILISNQWWMVQRGERGVAVVPCLGGTNCLGEMMELPK